MSDNKESTIQAEILAAIGALPDVRIWRNETAGVWTGKVAGRTRSGGVLLETPSRMTAGLCKGSSDLIGVGPGGRFLAIEVKTKRGRATDEQMAFVETVRAMGGIAGICRSPEDALALIEEARNG